MDAFQENICMKELIYKGSTKDIYQISGEEYLFEFSDRYSIFDFGEMPDLIKSKGLSSARLTSYLFPYIEKMTQVKTHFLKMGEKENQIIVKRFHVPRNIESDVFYQNRPINAFVPLEVIFRLGVPEGSSLIKRGYSQGEKFSKPMVEFSTKLESIDRMVSINEAKLISGINDQEMEKLISITQNLANVLKAKFWEFEIELWDGKFEFAFCEGEHKDCRDFVLVDSISLDELRLTFHDLMLSKEVLRNFYKQTSWYKDLVKAKTDFGDSFRSHLNSPDHLPNKLLKLIEEMYGNATSVIVGKDQNNKSNLNDIVWTLKNEYFNNR